MQFSNRLKNSLSPYLLQHANNPVDWYQWGEEALQLSLQSNKPILVSIGYSSCHWCHVMERESFEVEETAKIMNDHFINIKIDREERPDLDHIYMDAVQAMTGSGGWPLNVFLTPQLKPFYGGTYFPPKNAHGRLSWTETLLSVSHAYNHRNEEIENQAEKLTEHINKSNLIKKTKADNFDNIADNLQKIANNILAKADIDWGGFGSAPKFPQTYSIQYLLRHYHFTKEKKSLNQALLSLDKMILGGIYDHIGGGFSRYSTDEKWLAPHFEKMLYDNALLISVISEAYQITNNELYATTIQQTLEFVEREMMSNEHAFYSALDADSEGVEGKFYSWSKKEIEKILNGKSKLFCEVYNITEHGNWEHTNIVWLTNSIKNYAEINNLEFKTLTETLSGCRNLLLKEREKRIRPLLDDKSLCSWNALMNSAYCKAFAATENEHYRNVAIKNMDFILSNFFKNGELMHCYKNSQAYINGFLDDYAYLIFALIQLQEITGNQDYLLKAKELSNYVIVNFNNEDSPCFYFTQKSQKDIIVRKVDVYDGATPSANAILTYSFYYLSFVFIDSNFSKKAKEMVNSLQTALINYPTSFGAWASVYQIINSGIKEIIVTGTPAKTEILKIVKHYIPNKILLVFENKNSAFETISSDKIFSNEALFYLCEKETCYPPQKNLTNFLLFNNILIIILQPILCN